MAKKDLSSLKARLAKKAGPADVPPPGESAAPPADAPPAADVPAPGEQLAPPVDDIPAPGEVAADIPAPGEQMAPPAEPEPAAADGAPFQAPSAFDPNAGIIEDTGAGAPSKGGAGAIIGIAVVGLVVGVGLGWFAAGASERGTIVNSGKTMGKKNVASFGQVKTLREAIAGGLPGALTAVDEDPAAGAAVLTDLITTNFEPYPKIDDMFGWQLGALHPDDINSLFSAYDGVNRMAFELGTLATFINENGKALKGGPSQFAVLYEGEGATLVELVSHTCDMEAKTACAAGGEGKATGLEIREVLGGKTRHVAIESASPLNSGGGVYQFVFRGNPADNAKNAYAPLRASAEAKLAALGTYEAGAAAALERFAGSPTVDDATAQPSASGSAAPPAAPAAAPAPADGGGAAAPAEGAAAPAGG